MACQHERAREKVKNPTDLPLSCDLVWQVGGEVVLETVSKPDVLTRLVKTSN